MRNPMPSSAGPPSSPSPPPPSSPVLPSVAALDAGAAPLLWWSSGDDQCCSLFSEFARIKLVKRIFPVLPTLAVVVLATIDHITRPACQTGLFGSSPLWYWINSRVAWYPLETLWPSPNGGRDVHYLLFILALVVSIIEYGTERATGSQNLGWAAGYSLHTLAVLLLVLRHYHARQKDIKRFETDSGQQYGSWLAIGVTAISVIFTLLSAWSYDPKRHRFFQSLVIYFLLPMQGVVLFIDRKQNVRFSYFYAIFYSILGMRVPDFLAFGSVRLFASLAQQNNAYFQNSDALRYAVSVGYLTMMMLYIRLLKRIVESMSAPDTFPRFLFHAQFYCYACYYILISTARRLDALFFVMLVVMNIYYVLNNTGTLSEWTDRYIWQRCFPASGQSLASSSSPSSMGSALVSGKTSPKPFHHSLTRPGPAGTTSTSNSSNRRLHPHPQQQQQPQHHDEDDHVSPFSDRNRLVQLAFRIKIAEQDLIADSTALLAIPTLITVFAFLASREALGATSALEAAEGSSVVGSPIPKVMSIRVEHYDGAPLDLANLWLRFGIMFFARWVSSHASKRVFSCKIKGSFFFRSYLMKRKHVSDADKENDLDAVEEDEEREPLRREGDDSDVENFPDENEGGDSSDHRRHLHNTRARRPGTAPAPPTQFDLYTDSALRGSFFNVSALGDDPSNNNMPTKTPQPPLPPPHAHTQQKHVEVDQFQNAVLEREFPNVVFYFTFIVIHSLYSLFQNPHMPTRYAFCSFVKVES